LKLRLFFIWCVAALTSTAQATPTLSAANPPPNATLGAFSFGYRAEYFFSTQNLGVNSGDTDALSGDGEYSNFSNMLEAAYTLPMNLRLSLGGTFAYAESFSLAFGPRTDSRFNRVSVGAQYYKDFGRLLFVPMFLANIALEEVNQNEIDVLTSEATNQYQLGAWFKYPVWKFDNWIYGGYRFQGDQKADHLIWGLGTRFFPAEWFVQGGVTGFIVARNDLNDFFPINRTLPNQRLAAGSLRYNSVDPEWIEGELIAGYRSKQGYEFSGGINHQITGRNTGYGPTFLLNFSMDFNLDGRKIDSANRISETGQFNPDYETYDESVFNEK